MKDLDGSPTALLASSNNAVSSSKSAREESGARRQEQTAVRRRERPSMGRVQIVHPTIVDQGRMDQTCVS